MEIAGRKWAKLFTKFRQNFTLGTLAHNPFKTLDLLSITITHNMITKLIPNNFGSVIPSATVPNIIHKEFGKGFSNSLLPLITETKQFQTHIGSAIAEQELPIIILKNKVRFGNHVVCNGASRTWLM